MKYVLIAIAMLFVFFSTSPSSLAFVVEGDSSSSTSTTTIQGDGTVTTHMESTVNGNTKTLDSNTPGSYTLTNSSEEITSHPSPTLSAKIPSPTPTKVHKLRNSLALIEQLRRLFHTSLQKLLAFFHL